MGKSGRGQADGDLNVVGNSHRCLICHFQVKEFKLIVVWPHSIQPTLACSQKHKKIGPLQVCLNDDAHKTVNIIQYMFTYIFTYMFTHIVSYMFTYIFTYMFTTIVSYMFTYIFTYMFTDIFTYMYTYIFTYIHYITSSKEVGKQSSELRMNYSMKGGVLLYITSQ